MGQSTDGILAFGWNLGSVEDRDEGHWAFDLLERISDADDRDEIYLATTGIELPPDPWDEVRDQPNEWFYEAFRPGEFTRRETAAYQAWSARTEEARQLHRTAERDALASVDFELIEHCSCDYPMYILALKGVHWWANRGSAVDVTSVLGWAPDGSMIKRLYDAANLLGVEPPEPPSLLLASLWC